MQHPYAKFKPLREMCKDVAELNTLIIAAQMYADRMIPMGYVPRTFNMQVKHTSHEIWTHEMVPGHTKNVRGTPARKMVKVMIYRCDANGLLDNGNDWDTYTMKMELEQGRTLWNSHAASGALRMTTDLCQFIFENNPMRAI
tara:strand:+ start:858 stop:1283 length:426 start_codon:yes stop_codon:yes gene_type:complete